VCMYVCMCACVCACVCVCVCVCVYVCMCLCVSVCACVFLQVASGEGDSAYANLLAPVQLPHVDDWASVGNISTFYKSRGVEAVDVWGAALV